MKDQETNIDILILSLRKFLKEYECTEVDQAFLECLQETGNQKIRDFDDEKFIEWLLYEA